MAAMREPKRPGTRPVQPPYRHEKGGLATTFAGSSPPRWGEGPYSATRNRSSHWTVAHGLAPQNGLQPGVFGCLQLRDLVGALPIPSRNRQRPRGRSDDFRWLTEAGWNGRASPAVAEVSIRGLAQGGRTCKAPARTVKDPSRSQAGLKVLLAARRSTDGRRDA